MIGLCREIPCFDEKVFYDNTLGSRRRCLQDRSCGDTNDCPSLLDDKHIIKLFKHKVKNKTDRVNLSAP